MTPWLPENLRAWTDRFTTANTRQQEVLQRTTRIEPLEERVVLSATGLGDPASPETAQVAAEQIEESVTIRSLQLQVNHERVVELSPTSGPAMLQAGDFVQVVGVVFDVVAGPDGLEGIMAAEGYIHKVPAAVDGGAGAFDYADGRFGGATTRDPIMTGELFHGGLSEGWTVEDGWDRISITLIRYFGNDSKVEASFHGRLQVGEPDFVITRQLAEQVENMKTLTVGDTVELTGGWSNNGTGRFHNYMEVDVFNIENPNQAVWVGVLVGNVNADGTVAGGVENHNTRDSFTTHWTPDQAGKYMLLVAVDPESSWAETDETNNRQKLYVTVHETRPTEDTSDRDKQQEFDSEKISREEARQQRREQRELRKQARRQQKLEERRDAIVSELRDAARERGDLFSRSLLKKLRNPRLQRDELTALAKAFGDKDLLRGLFRGRD